MLHRKNAIGILQLYDRQGDCAGKINKEDMLYVIYNQVSKKWKRNSLFNKTTVVLKNSFCMEKNGKCTDWEKGFDLPLCKNWMEYFLKCNYEKCYHE